MAVRFDAAGEHYTSTSTALSTFTVTFWVKLSADRNAISGFFSQDNGGGDDGDYLVVATQADGVSPFVFAGSDGVDPIGAMTVGTWYRFGIVHAPGTSLTLYQGAAGAALSTGTGWGTSSTPTDWTIARSGATVFDEWMNGCVASLKVHSAALTQAEVENELAQYAPARTAGLYRWHALLGTGTATADWSGNARTLSGGTGAATEDGPPIPWIVEVPRLILPAAAAATTATAENAAGSGTANNAAPKVTATAENAAGTGTANNAAPKVTATAENAAGTGTANDGAFRYVNAENAAGTGTANAALPVITVAAGNAAGTGAANDAAVTISDTQAAENAAGTGEANTAAAKVTVAAGLADGSGEASAPRGALRMFLSATTSAQATSPATGAWDDTTGDGKFVLGTAPAGTSEELARSESNATANWDVLLGTWVSDPVTRQGDILTGDVYGLTVSRFATPSGASLDQRQRLYVIDSSGTVQGSSLFNSVGTIDFNETTPTAVNTAGTVTTGRTVNVGERLVLEIGYRQVAASGTTVTGSVWAGGTGTHLTAGSTDEENPAHITLPIAHLFAEVPTATPSTAEGTGTANDAAVQITPNAGDVSVTGTANNTVPAVASGGANQPAGTGTSNAPGGSATFTSEIALGGGAAHNALPMVNTGTGAGDGTGTANPPGGSATFTSTAAEATGTANVAPANIGAAAATGAGTGEANDPAVQTQGADTSVNAATAEATGTANNAALSVVPTGATGDGTGTGNRPAGSVSTIGNTGTGSGDAEEPGWSTRVSTGNAAATGTANNVAPNVATGGTNQPAGTGAAGQPTPRLTTFPATGEGTGTGNGITPTIVVTIAGLAAGTGVANNPAPATTPGAAEGAGAVGAATAGVGTRPGTGMGSGTANRPAAQTVTATAATATGVGAAETPAASVAIDAAGAEGAGQASNASAGNAVTAEADPAEGTGTANNAVCTVTFTSGVAGGTGAANDAARAPRPDTAAGSGAANNAVCAVTFTSGAATGTGAAFDATAGAQVPTLVPAQVAGGDGAALDASVLVGGQRQPGGWSSLLHILEQARRDAREDRDAGRACPHCGEPYTAGPNNEPFCRFDGYSPKGRGPHVKGRDWGGLVAALSMPGRADPAPTLDELRAGWGP